MPTDHEITQLLRAWSEGDDAALDALAPLVLQDLRRLASYLFQEEPTTHTLQPTALVSELYLRLRGGQAADLESRKDFFNFAAYLMRHILVDWARRRRTHKRGGAAETVSIDGEICLELGIENIHLDAIDLHDALTELERLDERQASIVKLKFFLGLTNAEIASSLDISLATVKREWKTAKLWLYRRLTGTLPGRLTGTPSEID